MEFHSVRCFALQLSVVVECKAKGEEGKKAVVKVLLGRLLSKFLLLVRA